MSAANDAIKYSRQIVKGKRVACKRVKQSCQRFLDDLDRKDLEFKPRAAERVVHFIEQFNHVKGPLRRKPFKLEPWQKFIIANVFGFYYLDGLRRFNIAFLLVPRKNGKSTFLALLGLYMLLLDDPGAAEVYCGATTEEQANYVFGPAKLFVKHCPDLRRDFGIVDMAESINVPDEDSFFKRVIGDPGDGANPNCWIVDEYHEHKTNALYETGETGMGGRQNPILWCISTAGHNVEGPCHEAMEDCVQILDGIFDDVASDSTFVMLFGVDKGDRWDSIAAMRKANPNYGVSVSVKWLKKQLAAAKRSPSKINAYKTKHLNMWVNAANPLFDIDDWYACGDSSMTIEDVMHLPCIGAIDLSSRLDFTAEVKTFYEKIDGKMHYYFIPTFWLPEERIIEVGAPEHYSTWRNEDLIEICIGDEISKQQVVDHIIDSHEDLSTEEIVFDPWRSMD